MKFKVTKDGKELSPDLYTWDEETKTFSTNEDKLVLDFSGWDGVTFKTGSFCTFKTGAYCTFDTWHDCIFKTESDCTFDTGPKCVIVRRDVFEVIQPMADENHIKLNGYGVKGYQVLKNHTIIVDGEEVELSEDGYASVKELLK